jgi:tight adherence protein B
MAVTSAVVVLVVTRWPVMAVAAAAAVWWLSGREAQTRSTAIERTEALATWAEMLRDATGTPRGIEGVLVTTASSAPVPIRGIVLRFADRLTYEPLELALPGLADDLDHPLGDQIVASIGLTATAGAREIRAVLDDLAAAARDEARMLRRLEVSRQRPRSDMRQVIVIVTAVIGALSLVGRDYLQPYSSLGGQLVLAIAGALWIAGFMWMNRLGRIDLPRRFLDGEPLP